MRDFECFTACVSISQKSMGVYSGDALKLSLYPRHYISTYDYERMRISNSVRSGTPSMKYCGYRLINDNNKFKTIHQLMFYSSIKTYLEANSVFPIIANYISILANRRSM